MSELTPEGSFQTISRYKRTLEISKSRSRNAAYMSRNSSLNNLKSSLYTYFVKSSLYIHFIKSPFFLIFTFVPAGADAKGKDLSDQVLAVLSKHSKVLRFRAKRGQLQHKTAFLPECQVQNLVLSVFYVPSLLNGRPSARSPLKTLQGPLPPLIFPHDANQIWKVPTSYVFLFRRASGTEFTTRLLSARLCKRKDVADEVLETIQGPPLPSEEGTP